VTKIGAHKNEAFDLLKLNCKINDELVYCLLNSQGIIKALLKVALKVKLFCMGVQFFENFTLCDLNNFDVILGNTFLDAYEVTILCNGHKLKFCAKCGSKLMNLDVNNFTLVEMGVNLVVLASELESPCFLLLMSLRVSHGEPKPQEAKQPPTFILDSFNKILKVLIDELPDALPPYREVDHKIEVVPRSAPLSKTPYILNQKELEKLKN
jgi:hypothetical protein